MTLDATVPIDHVLNALWPTYVREDREEINLLWRAIVAGAAAESTHEMGAGEFALEIGTDINDVVVEAINLTGAVAVNLIQITNGSGGMLKIIRAGDGNVTVKHNPSYIYLSGETDFNLAANNVLTLLNIGGDPDASINGVWYEVSRSTNDVGWAASYTAVNMSVGDTTINVGSQLNNVGIETVGLTADAAVNLTYITNGRAGMIKFILALDNNVTVIQNEASTANGTFYLNSPAGVDLTMATNDLIALVNIGGNGTIDGYWREMFRTLHV